MARPHTELLWAAGLDYLQQCFDTGDWASEDDIYETFSCFNVMARAPDEGARQRLAAVMSTPLATGLLADVQPGAISALQGAQFSPCTALHLGRLIAMQAVTAFDLPVRLQPALTMPSHDHGPVPRNTAMTWLTNS
jgi:hypothetical protein